MSVQRQSPSAAPSLLASARVQFRVILALMIRDGQASYTNRTFGFFWTIIDPLILTCGVILLWTLANQGEGHKGVSIVALALTAYSHIQLWRLTVLPSIVMLRTSAWAFYHQNIHIIDVLVAHSLMRSVSIFTSFVVIASVCVLFGVIEPIRDPGLVVAAWMLDTLFCFCFAVLTAALAAQSEIVEKLVHPLMYLTLPLTGAFVMTDWLPPRAKVFMEWVPLANCCEMFRAGVFSLFVKTYWSVPLIVLSSLFLLAIGLPLLEYARRRFEEAA